ncbi:MAG: hypothetical protein Q8S00_28605 [Deltaproteobacteria bacterium]|nr:hypothetical protein [Deltaproteobacteria bacterium]
MKQPYSTLIVVIVISVFTSAYGGERKPVTPVSYKLSRIDAEMYGVLDINNKGELLIERQLVQYASPVPLLINKKGGETAPFECPGTTNDTDGVALNNRGEIVGHCGHAPGFTVHGFIANPESGSVSLFAYPGAISTWAFGINDFGQVVGYYQNQPPPGCCFLLDTFSHGFLWDKASGEYRTIDNPLAYTKRGGPTWLTGINKKGQIVGFYFGNNYTFNEVYSFIYDNGTFTPVEHPDAWEAATFIYGFNNNGQIFGEYDGPTCSNRCLFLYDSGEYFDVSLPLPDNAPYPNGMIIYPASAFNFAGLNDKGQFVGTYHRILEWGPDPFHPGEFEPTKTELVNFIATPVHHGNHKEKGKN